MDVGCRTAPPLDTNGGLTIRDARADERDAVRALTLEAYEDSVAAEQPDFWHMYRSVLLATLDRDEPVDRIVAARGGTLVGSVLLCPPGEDYGGVTEVITWPEVRLLAVAPAARGHGVAAALMAACIARTRQRGAVALGLHTSDEFAVAQAMYIRMGFVRVPSFDFSPESGNLVKAYRLDLHD